MKVRYDTYCGLYCGACPVGKANEAEDGILLAGLAREWGREPGDLRCGGCKSDVTAVFCTDCRIRLCASERGLEFCHQCDDFPCGVLAGFRNDNAPHHSVVLRNLSRMKELGIEQWLEEEARRWSCGSCGEVFGWYSDECSRCGGEVYNSVEEEKDLEC
jgi:hypothetical protein